MPETPSPAPRCSPFAKAAGELWLRARGWRVEAVPLPHPKFVLIAAPHTSNWDAAYMLATAGAMGIRLSWLAKDSLFTFPLGTVMRATGGIPVDRSQRNRLVDDAVALLRRSERLILAVSPEGTRSHAGQWRSGFYHIARQAEVPLGLGYLDYAKRTCGIKAFLTPPGNLAQDMAFIRATYEGTRGRYPERETVPRLKDEGAAG